MKTIIRDYILVTEHEKEVEVEVEVDGYLEKNYGADADGNRGQAAWFISDMRYEIPDTANCGKKVTASEKIDLHAQMRGILANEDFDFEEE